MSYHLITIPIAAGLITQAIKLTTDGIKGNFTFKNLRDYGGMPSAHSSIVAALLTELFLSEGCSPLFVASLIFSFFIILDAKGLRNYVGKSNKEINKLTGGETNLNEKVGHTTAEIITGSILGMVIGIIGVLLM